MEELTIDTILAMDAAEMARQLSGPAEERASFVRVAAEAGVSDAQAVYGQMLLDGIGVTTNPQQAATWFAKAAQQEHLVAINMVGRCYELGWGVPVDKGSAAEWYKAAADRGMAWAMYNYATLLMTGDGVPEDRPAALALFRRAAAAGHVKAMNFIGSFYEDGWVVDRDMDVAAEHYAKAAAGGDFRGQFNHARLLAEKGRVGEAVVWLARIPETANDAFLQKVRDYLDESPIESFRDAKALLNR